MPRKEPISDGLFNMLRKKGEDRKAMLNRLRTEVKTRGRLAKMLLVSKRHVYRIYKRYNIPLGKPPKE